MKIKSLLEKYQVNTMPADSRKTARILKKNIAKKTDDANGNKDDVFNASNVKVYDRHDEHGYNSGEDEKVYESEQIDEISKNTLKSYVKKASTSVLDHTNKATELYKQARAKGVPERGAPPGEKELKAGNKHMRKAEHRAASRELAKSKISRKPLRQAIIGQDKIRTINHDWHIKPRVLAKEQEELLDALYNSLDEENQKIFVDTNIGELLEYIESLDEISKKTLRSYIKKSGRSAANLDDAAERYLNDYYKMQKPENKSLFAKAYHKANKKSDQRLKGIIKASHKLSEESETLEEGAHLDIYTKYHEQAVDAIKEIAQYLAAHKTAITTEPSDYIDTWGIKDLSRSLQDICDRICTSVEDAEKSAEYRKKAKMANTAERNYY